jgi:hypothetical protein
MTVPVTPARRWTISPNKLPEFFPLAARPARGDALNFFLLMPKTVTSYRCATSMALGQVLARHVFIVRDDHNDAPTVPPVELRPPRPQGCPRDPSFKALGVTWLTLPKSRYPLLA